jgi:tetratricopeptide (TPR) repeat protein
MTQTEREGVDKGKAADTEVKAEAEADADAEAEQTLGQGQGQIATFLVEELAGMEVMVKKVELRSKVLPYIRQCCPVDEVADGPDPDLPRAIALQSTFREHVLTIFSHSSPEMAAASIRLADLYALAGDLNRAEELTRDCLSSMLEVEEMAGEVLLGCLYLMALICEKAQNFEAAEAIYAAILQRMLDLYDSIDDPNSASPFEIELHDRLAALLQRRSCHADAQRHIHRANAIRAIFCIDPAISETTSASARRRVLNFLAFNNLSGYAISTKDAGLDQLLALFS